jgi:hypothetical protein
MAWTAVAIALSLLGYITYARALQHDTVQPTRTSWLIWSAATGLEAITYAAVNAGSTAALVLLVSAAACIVITLAIWRRGAWTAPTTQEAVCMGACLSALLLWTAFQDAFWAHMLVVAAVPVSFWPTWQSVRADPSRERTPAWALWTLGDAATLLIAADAARLGVAEYAYLVVELACHASVWLMIGVGSIISVGTRTTDRRAAQLFTIRDTHLGKAVFSQVRFAEGATLMEFTGRRLPVRSVPHSVGTNDRYLQVTADHYMGPSGRLDDLVNHSCRPNAGLRFLDDRVSLIAIRDIASGDEICWDYATTLTDPDWHMICQCRSPECRRVVGSFWRLPAEQREYYRSRNLVAPYLRRRDVVTTVGPALRRLAR